ncbi:ATP-dependent DNA helicase PIF1-like protein [Tanacetum coccineum]
MYTGSQNTQTTMPTLTYLLQRSVRIDSNTITRQDGRVQSYCGHRLTETTLGLSDQLVFQDTTTINIAQIAGPSTSRYASTRRPQRSAGPMHLRPVRKGTNKMAYTFAAISVTYHNIGHPSHQCRNCGATMWYEEREVKAKHTVNPTFSLCCQGGKMLLPRFKDAPPPLNHLLNLSNASTAKFRDQIRVYNSMFSFTSFRAKIDHSINTGRGPYTFRINGQNYHRMGSLLPQVDMHPKFAQLYFFDTHNELRNRTSAFIDKETSDGIDEQIVASLIQMLDKHNSVAKAFRMTRDWCTTHNSVNFHLRLHSERKTTKQYNALTVSEVAALIVNDFRDGLPTRDIIVNGKDGRPKRVSELHPSYMALQYPLLFPYGEDGFHDKIPYHTNTGSRKTKRGYVTMKEYYIYIIQQRPDESSTLLKEGRMFQQYLVDAYTAVEEQRLNWTRNNQDTLRIELYHNLCDAVIREDTSAVGLGKRIVLPRTFTGSPRYMMHNYQDAMAMCRTYGNPDLFITFTSNPKWPEISEMLSYFPGAIKYLFKYLNKGPDRATIVIEENVKKGTAVAQEQVLEIDEIKNYPNCRFLAPCDAVWRLFSFDINYSYPSVMQLSFHLPNQNAITLRDSKKLPALLEKEGIDVTIFTNWFELNKRDLTTRAHTYAEIPKHYVWHEKEKHWKQRKQRKCIGRTAHNRFVIPLELMENNTCRIEPNTQLAKLMQEVQLIIWDEAPMTQRYAFEALDITLRDILGFKESDRRKQIFGGMTMLLGGDFRQILPVFTLTRSMIVNEYSTNEEIDTAKQEFNQWVLAVDNGTLPAKIKDDAINEFMFKKSPGEVVTYNSADEICKASTDNIDQHQLYPVEFLNNLNFPGMPPQEAHRPV